VRHRQTTEKLNWSSSTNGNWLQIGKVSCILCLRYSDKNYYLHSADIMVIKRFIHIVERTRMWANAHRDGRPAEYRWHPLYATKCGWHPLLECRAVMLPRWESRWNVLGCPKLAIRSQLLVGQSLPYCEDMWRRYCCLTRRLAVALTLISTPVTHL